MTRTEQLADAARSLSDEQFDGLLTFVRSLRGQPYFETASEDALASLDQGLADAAAGRVIAAADAFREIDAKIDAYGR